MVDYLYKDIHQMTPKEIEKLEALEQTTPFDRGQILDLYTKFKALTKLSTMRKHSFEDKTDKKHLEIMDDYLELVK